MPIAEQLERLGYTNVKFDIEKMNDYGEYIGVYYQTDQGRVYYDYDLDRFFIC